MCYFGHDHFNMGIKMVGFLSLSSLKGCKCFFTSDFLFCSAFSFSYAYISKILDPAKLEFKLASRFPAFSSIALDFCKVSSELFHLPLGKSSSLFGCTYPLNEALKF